MFLAIRNRLNDREEGFTLIELLVVVIIIGILAAVAIPTFLNQRQRAYRTALQSDLRNIAVEAETYFSDNPATGYTGFTQPATFRTSPQVTLTIVAANQTATTYCVSGVHAGLTGVTWSIRNNPGAGLPALNNIAC